MHKTIIGVMGPGEKATAKDIEVAYEIGKLVAMEDWVLLTGGRNVGVMDAACKGAKEAKGLTIGILPTDEKETFSEAVDIAIITGMNSARNNINVLSSNVVVACGIGAGTTSEIALAIKANKKVILINQDSQDFFKKIGGENIIIVHSPKEVITSIKELLER